MVAVGCILASEQLLDWTVAWGGTGIGRKSLIVGEKNVVTQEMGFSEGRLTEMGWVVNDCGMKRLMETIG
jgi:hypothetical protein